MIPGINFGGKEMEGLDNLNQDIILHVSSRVSAVLHRDKIVVLISSGHA